MFFHDMKRTLLPKRLLAAAAVFSTLFLFGCSCGGNGGGPARVRVMSFNVLCSFCNAEEYDPWEQRLEYFKDIFNRHDPDLIGLQELSFANEVDQILGLKPGYEAVYYKVEYVLPNPDSTIFYRANRFELVESGFYWLSPFPDKEWSGGFSDDAVMSRIVAWAHLRQKKDGRQMLFITTHFDNTPPNQEKSAPLLLERTAPWAEKMPVIVTGDFNSQPSDPAYRILVEGTGGSGFHFVNAFDIVKTWSIFTNLDPAPQFEVEGRIDHIFLGGSGAGWQSPEWIVNMKVYGENKRFPSDHRAISAEIVF